MDVIPYDLNTMRYISIQFTSMSIEKGKGPPSKQKYDAIECSNDMIESEVANLKENIICIKDYQNIRL